MASRNLHKRTKFGQLPGDIPIGAKIHMLEGGDEFYLFPWQKITKEGMKVFKNEFVQKANRRFRRERPTVEE